MSILAQHIKQTDRHDQVFQDGVYLELISFTHPLSHYPPSSPEHKKRESNPWASKLPGWIDYAFLGNSSTSISEIINKRAIEDGSGVEYLPEVKGGRERPDGKVLEWMISGPGPGLERGTVPFFCGDVTPREWRVSYLQASSAMTCVITDRLVLQVPFDLPSNIHHPSTASGIEHVRVLVDEKDITTLSNKLMSIVDSQPIIKTETETAWVLDTPTTSSSQSGYRGPQLIVSTPKQDDEREALKDRGPGVYEVALRVDKCRGGGSVNTPYGKIVWHPE